MTTDQLRILQHALGANRYGQIARDVERNHYVGGKDECRPLVVMGYMTEHKAREITGGDPWFTVTDAGRKAMREESPLPPKLTRSQQRYREYLDFSDAFECTFKEFLRIQKTDWYQDMKAGKSMTSIFDEVTA